MSAGAALLWFTPLRRSAAADFLGWFCPLLQSFHIWLFQIYFLLTHVISLWLAGLLELAEGGVAPCPGGPCSPTLLSPALRPASCEDRPRITNLIQ